MRICLKYEGLGRLKKMVKFTGFYLLLKQYIVHICIDAMVIKDVHNTPQSFFNINPVNKYLQRNTICLTDHDHDYIIDEILCREKIEYERIYEC